MTTKSPLAQVACWRCLIAFKSRLVSRRVDAVAGADKGQTFNSRLINALVTGRKR